jgi:YVTN family beta-propeller protein
MAAAAPSSARPDAPEVRTLTQVATIPISNAPTGLADDAATGTVYATDKGAEAVYVISAATNTITATIPVGTGPRAVAVNPVTDTIYTANMVAGTVSVIDGATNTVTATIPGVPNAFSIAVNTTTNTVYVAASNGIAVIDGATNTVTGTINSIARALAVNSKTGRIYSGGGEALTVINGTTDRVITTLTGLPVDTDAIAVNTATNTVYISGRHQGVGVIDGKTDTLVTKISLRAKPRSIAVDQADDRLFTGGPGFVPVAEINARTDRVVADALVPHIYNITVDPQAKEIYVDGFRSDGITVYSF